MSKSRTCCRAVIEAGWKDEIAPPLVFLIKQRTQASMVLKHCVCCGCVCEDAVRVAEKYKEEHATHQCQE